MVSAETEWTATHIALGATLRPIAPAIAWEISSPLSITVTVETNSAMSTTRLRREACSSRSAKRSMTRSVHSQLMIRWNSSGTMTATLSHS